MLRNKYLSMGAFPRWSTLLSLLFLCFLLACAGGRLKFVKAMENRKSWCVAKPSASDAELASNIDYACKILKDCKKIQKGGPCFNPNTLINHASVVMNQYYAAMGRNSWNCNFRGSAIVVLTDPSHNGCKYA